MRYMGIDFGSKRVGIAFSDEGESIAFPYGVIENAAGLVEEMGVLCLEHKIGGVVMGESKDFHGDDNKIMKDVLTLRETLVKKVGIPVYLEPEFLTSSQADRQTRSHKPDGRLRNVPQLRKGDSLLDASAAALILQSFLDRRKNNAEKEGSARNEK